jgi:hypothetical protein
MFNIKIIGELAPQVSTLRLDKASHQKVKKNIHLGRISPHYEISTHPLSHLQDVDDHSHYMGAKGICGTFSNKIRF